MTVYNYRDLAVLDGFELGIKGGDLEVADALLSSEAIIRLLSQTETAELDYLPIRAFGLRNWLGKRITGSYLEDLKEHIKGKLAFYFYPDTYNVYVVRDITKPTNDVVIFIEINGTFSGSSKTSLKVAFIMNPEKETITRKVYDLV